MASKPQFPDLPLEDWPDEARRPYIEKLPRRAREYIAYLEGEIKDLEEELDEEAAAETFAEAMFDLWTTIARRRFQAFDDVAGCRALMAAEIARSA